MQGFKVATAKTEKRRHLLGLGMSDRVMFGTGTGVIYKVI